MKHLPNILTVLRILITPLFLFCLFSDFHGSKYYALFLFIFASLTDAFDGYYARKHNIVSDLGIFLDPLADKILVSSAFISFAILGYIDYWMFIIIIFRDIAITALRLLMIRNGYTMITSNIAKYKTASQVFIIIFTLSVIPFSSSQWLSTVLINAGLSIFDIVYFLTLVVTIFTAITGIAYFLQNKTQLKKIISFR